MLPINVSDTDATSQDDSSLEFVPAIVSRQCYIQDASGKGLCYVSSVEYLGHPYTTNASPTSQNLQKLLRFVLTNCSPTDPTSQWATCYTYLHFSRYTKQQGLDALPYEAPNVKGLHKSKIKRVGEGLVLKREGRNQCLHT